MIEAGRRGWVHPVRLDVGEAVIRAEVERARGGESCGARRLAERVWLAMLGVRCGGGRPRAGVDREAEIEGLLRAGWSHRRIMRELGVGGPLFRRVRDRVRGGGGGVG